MIVATLLGLLAYQFLHTFGGVLALIVLTAAIGGLLYDAWRGA